jgi:hypothetical protein
LDIPLNLDKTEMDNAEDLKNSNKLEDAVFRVI